ncbi:outer membrane beta-barrel protein [Hydrogenivirga sp. 128-5-R1-1]|uniref:outer membrane beta-barrel protein n=1 Tax=Hydrogenivirga sp. 128-5-R1-1 TaxID=392423 RepID=UPI00015F1686|nr:outer membrane beta-barrel protein [Hydrogenivirga sp. 128-5-R1-1]EDP73948.1 hypothetical protein HG1285_04983 [Hydrogenivirga sp. 128-5-R1-1]
MKKLVGTLAAAGFLAVSATAGTINVANSDIEMEGGVSAGYFYTSNIGSSNTDYFTVSSFAVDLKAEAKPIGFTAGFGASGQPDLLDATQPPSPNFELEYGWVSIKPIEGLTLNAGLLTTNIGYELYHTYDNPNYTFGMVWYGQPFVYPGARATYTVAEGIDVYAEYNQDSGDAFAVGSIGSIGNINYAVSYYDYAANKNLVDVVLSTNVSGIDIGVNADYQWYDDTAKTAGNDDSAYGVALYVIPSLSKTVSIPVRIEYINQGTSGIYAAGIGKNAKSFTITPTWKPTENTYLRAEFSYVSTDKKGFTDDKGNNKDSRTFAGVEAGFLF